MFIHPHQILKPLVISTVLAAVWATCATNAFASGDISADEPIDTAGVIIKPAGAEDDADGPLASKVFTVVDGDTLIVAGVRIRLWGIDAPEIAQLCQNAEGADWQCGLAAKQFLETAVSGSTLVCERRAEDRYGRTVAVCKYGADFDVAAVMVSNGYALDWPKYSGGAYREHQSAAVEASNGIWSGEFVEPWTYRRANKS